MCGVRFGYRCFNYLAGKFETSRHGKAKVRIAKDARNPVHVCDLNSFRFPFCDDNNPREFTILDVSDVYQDRPGVRNCDPTSSTTDCMCSMLVLCPTPDSQCNIQSSSTPQDVTPSQGHQHPASGTIPNQNLQCLGRPYVTRKMESLSRISTLLESGMLRKPSIAL
jgi:hypothetical protein